MAVQNLGLPGREAVGKSQEKARKAHTRAARTRQAGRLRPKTKATRHGGQVYFVIVRGTNLTSELGRVPAPHPREVIHPLILLNRKLSPLLLVGTEIGHARHHEFWESIVGHSVYSNLAGPSPTQALRELVVD